MLQKKDIKIYISGNINGSYRAQNIIKCLGDEGIKFHYSPIGYLASRIKIKYLRKIISISTAFLIAPYRIIIIALSSHVFVLPMNQSASAIAEILIGKLFRKKIIVDYYISLYDTIVNDRKIALKNSIAGKISFLKDWLLLKSASQVIFLNNSESIYYTKIAGQAIDSSRIKIIPLCIDYKKETFSSRKISKNDFNVCWWGTYIPLHGLNNVIEAFSYIKNKEIKLHLFGDSDLKAQPYIKKINELGLQNQIFVVNNYSFANGKLAPHLVTNCDLSIGNFGDSEKAKTVLVNKLVDSLSLGIPCLTMSTSATRELFDKDEGLIISESDPREIARSIEKCAEDRERIFSIGQAGKKKYFEMFSPDSFKLKLIEVLMN
ncbi:glycosyltransferase [Orrella marina]|uniref:Glycosyl transferase family 1 domain-containing protein n=1 Tax=Orrella marina TaxID=2163011 RepID=A0A2R4XH53_9BURK|nr:glycosyltransferase [Orrella marina]AWB33039.1 hypothetical protein DBV39_04115 [Orrella marina]